VNGYFWALFIFNIVSSVILGYLAFKPLGWSAIEWPSRKELKRLFKELFVISMAIYIVKIIYHNWEKLGPNFLGLSVTPEIVGYFGFALLYAKKLMSISDSVTDVNLPVFSDKYVNEPHDFMKAFSKNFDKLFVFIIFAGASAVYWVPQIVELAIGGTKYYPSLVLILPMVFAFIFYSFTNIIKSSVIIPAKLVKEMILSFTILIVGTLVFYFGLKSVLGALVAMSYGMAAGSLISLLYLIIASELKLKFKLFHHEHVLLLIMAGAIALDWGVINIYVKTAAYIVFTGLFIWGVFVSRFVTKDDAQKVLRKIPVLSRP
jgi:O-antigen/teichoic acid export membrane protein